jgi:peroxiredoxin
MKYLLTILTAFSVLLAFNGAQASNPPQDLQLTDLNGKTIQLSQEKNQRLVIFWATWCDECRHKLTHELPELNARKDISVITINTDKDDDRVRAFVDKEKISLPVYRDPSKDLRKSLNVFSVPHWALYRKNPKTGSMDLVESEPAFDYEKILKLLGGV